MPEKYDVAIVGGGICGLATALTLKVSDNGQGADRLRIVVFDEGKLGDLSPTIQNGGTVHTGASYSLARSRSSKYEARYCRASADIIGAMIPDECVISELSNYLVGRENIVRYRRALDDLDIRHEPLPHHKLASILRPNRLQETIGVVVQELQVDMGAVMLRFAQACRDAGVEIITDKRISRIVCDTHGRVTGLLAEDGALIAARHVVVCAGDGASDLLRRSALLTDWFQRRFHRHRALHITVPESGMMPLRGAQAGFPVITQLRRQKSISLYGVPPKEDPSAAVDHVRRVFRSWLLPGLLELDDRITVSHVNKVEFHSPTLARSTLPRILNGPDLRVDGVFCLIPGKVSHAVSLALEMPRLLGMEAATAQALSDRLNCSVEPATLGIVRSAHGDALSVTNAVESVE